MVGGRCVHVFYTLGAYRRMYIGCLPIVVCRPGVCVRLSLLRGAWGSMSPRNRFDHFRLEWSSVGEHITGRVRNSMVGDGKLLIKEYN